MRRVVAILPFLLIAQYTSTCHARTWYVTVDGTGDARTIQSAIDSAAAEDDVLVAPGRYTRSNQGAQDSYYLITMKSGLWLHSESGPEQTILDAEQQGGVVRCWGVDDRTTVEGFTITGGGSYVSGSGVECYAGGSPKIKGNIITDNGVWPLPIAGGGIYCQGNGTPEIRNNVISNNAACWGGGIACEQGCNVLIEENIIKNNGTGICWLEEYSDRLIDDLWRGARDRLTWTSDAGIVIFLAAATIRHNIVEENYADFGAGISASQSSVTISNNLIIGHVGIDGVALDCGSGNIQIYKNTIVGNSATDGSIVKLTSYGDVIYFDFNIVANSVQGSAVSCSGEPGAEVYCNDLWNNAGGDGNCDVPASYNFSVDPLFCDTNAGDYSVREDSECLQYCRPIVVGAFGEGCSVVRLTQTTWGRLKALYRR